MITIMLHCGSKLYHSNFISDLKKTEIIDSLCLVTVVTEYYSQGRIKASRGPGAAPNAGPLQTYNQLTTPINCGPQKLGPTIDG